MKSPIFIFGDNLLGFTSIEAAANYLEAVDVEDGIYKTAYDSEGRLLNFKIRPTGFGPFSPNPSPFIETAEESRPIWRN